MLLFCKYGVDASDPAAGIVIAHYEDGQAPDRDAHPGCTVISYDKGFETLDRFGPEPEARAPDDPRGPIIDWRPRAAPRLDVTTAQSAKLAELSDACGTAIAAGFTSAALGDPYTYPSSEEDQRNLVLAAGAAMGMTKTAGWSTDIKCAAKDGVPTRVAHTSAQVSTVLADFVAFKSEITGRLDNLKAAVASAATPDAVAKIVWG